MEVNIGIRENNFIHFERNKSNNLKKSIFQKYNLNKVGTIEFAKIHQSANRPLYKKSDSIFIPFIFIVSIKYFLLLYKGLFL